ncbi:outer membrane beta-barrel protein [uncultured Oxalicibacterium sp.]|uniref:outer membrane protein n=1 Tax=uncultured Oxalicibacterium sp. TaxID=1168540 RepID=UPI0025EE3986|nr:outer membrane beta-barrel protein [uncultured Oxalicibacterium sp.]
MTISKLKARSIYLAGVGTLPINEQFSLFAKAGLSANRLSVSWKENGVFQGTESKKRTSPMFGFGAKYNLSRSWSVVAEYENYGKTVKETIGTNDVQLKTHAFSLGARYSF